MSFMQPNPLWPLVPLGARRALRPNEACLLGRPHAALYKSRRWKPRAGRLLKNRGPLAIRRRERPQRVRGRVKKTISDNH